MRRQGRRCAPNHDWAAGGMVAAALSSWTDAVQIVWKKSVGVTASVGVIASVSGTRLAEARPRFEHSPKPGPRPTIDFTSISLARSKG